MSFASNAKSFSYFCLRSDPFLVPRAVKYSFLWISSASGLVLRTELRVLDFWGWNTHIRTFPVVVLISRWKQTLISQKPWPFALRFFRLLIKWNECGILRGWYSADAERSLSSSLSSVCSHPGGFFGGGKKGVIGVLIGRWFALRAACEWRLANLFCKRPTRTMLAFAGHRSFLLYVVILCYFYNLVKI